jgi:hypothetical protein
MNHWTNRPIGILLIILLAGTPELYAASGPASDGGTAAAATTNAAKTAPVTTRQALQDAVSPESLPDSPGTLIAKQNDPVAPQSNTSTQNPEAQQNDTQQPKTSSQSNTAPAQNGSANPGASQSENGQQPVGAAAAQLGRTTGGAASKPAGAALAPTQQRHSRSLLLKLGLLAGAGIAVGSVAALSKASPSRPPGH